MRKVSVFQGEGKVRLKWTEFPVDSYQQNWDYNIHAPSSSPPQIILPPRDKEQLVSMQEAISLHRHKRGSTNTAKWTNTTSFIRQVKRFRVARGTSEAPYQTLLIPKVGWQVSEKLGLWRNMQWFTCLAWQQHCIVAVALFAKHMEAECSLASIQTSKS